MKDFLHNIIHRVTKRLSLIKKNHSSSLLFQTLPDTKCHKCLNLFSYFGLWHLLCIYNLYFIDKIFRNFKMLEVGSSFRVFVLFVLLRKLYSPKKCRLIFVKKGQKKVHFPERYRERGESDFILTWFIFDSIQKMYQVFLVRVSKD